MRRKTWARATTLVELCVVLVIVGVLLTSAVAGMVFLTEAARVQQQLALIDVKVREARALAREQHVAYFVAPVGRTVTLTRGTCTDPNTCTPAGAPVEIIPVPDLTPAGATLAFNTDGRPPGSTTKVMTLDATSTVQLELGGAGTIRWTAAADLDERIDGKQAIGLSAQEVATK